MKRVHWFDQADYDNMCAGPAAAIAPAPARVTAFDANPVRHMTHDASWPMAEPLSLSSQDRLQRMQAKVNDVYRRMHGVRQRIQSLSRDMDDQLEETRQTNSQLTLVRAMVEQLRRETEEYDRQLKAYYEYEQTHYRRPSSPLRSR